MCVPPVTDAYRQMNERSTVVIAGRQGAGLLSGEDCEIAAVACDIGLGMGVFPELKITHLIPKERVSRNYLLQLYQGTVLSDILIAFKWRGTRPVSPLRPWGLLSILKNSIQLRGLDRQMYFARVALRSRRAV